MTDGVASEAILAGGGTVVTATHRLARQIHRRHDQQQAASGARAWPTADVLPLDAWLRRAWEFNLVRNSALGRLRLLADDESRLIWRRIVAAGGNDGLDAGVLVPLVASGWRLCQAWGIRDTDLVAGADSEDSRIFGQWVAQYVTELKRHGWIDQGGLLQAFGTSGVGSCVDRERLVGFAGFDPWTPLMHQLERGLEAREVATARITVPQRRGLVQVKAMRNPEDELACAFEWAANQAATADDARIAIVVPDLERDADSARRTGMDVLSPGWQLREPAVRPVALAAGRHLAGYPIVAAALNVLDMLMADIPFERASQLLRSVYVYGAAIERGERTRAELRLRRTPVEDISRRLLLEVLDKEGAVLAAGRWREASELADTVRHRRLSPGQWAGRFSEWLAMAGWPGDRGLGSEEFQAAEAWQHGLESFAATDEVAGPLSLREALGILGQWVRDRPFEPEAADSAIQVLSLRESAGQDFAALWICGMTADQWPPPARPHPLVPLSLQQSAGIPEVAATTVAMATRRQLERLISSADQVVLSWPVEREQAETLPSPLLAAWVPFPVASTDRPRHPDRERVAASAVVELVHDDSPPALGIGRLLRGGARVLAMQAVCPARAFVEFRLDAQPLERPAKPLDAATRGRIVHGLLESIYSAGGFSRGLGAVDVLDLRAAFDAALARVLARYLPAGDTFLAGLRRLEEERLWGLVQSLQALDAGRPPFHARTEVSREVSVGPLSLSIRLDRIDQLEDGGELVLDYKTGSISPGAWKKPRLPDSQLPLYAVTSGSRGFAVIEVKVPAAALRGVGDDAIAIPGVKSAAGFFSDPGLSWQEALRRWEHQLASLATEFVDGDFRVNPGDRAHATGQFAVFTCIHTLQPGMDEEPGEGTES